MNHLHESSSITADDSYMNQPRSLRTLHDGFLFQNLRILRFQETPDTGAVIVTYWSPIGHLLVTYWGLRASSRKLNTDFDASPEEYLTHLRKFNSEVKEMMKTLDKKPDKKPERKTNV
ncbi:unnamed protein product, partial [Mesorhabditis belari]|uniref:Uncharacterized protein n=1 Tax=Mesorhabditis belari TaxID=2138241 RepID=A0AAF3EUR3_9BILA